MAEKVEPRKSSRITTLRCPHGNEVTIAKMFGVIRYMHADGKPCQTMNRFDSNCHLILGQMVGVEMFDLHKRVTIIGLKSEKTIRIHVFKSLETMDATQLEEALLILIRYAGLDHSNSELYSEMRNDFGTTFIRNVQYLTEGGVVSMYAKQATDPRKPRRAMIDLSRMNLKGNIGSMYDGLGTTSQKRKSALSGTKISITGDSVLDDLLDSLDL